MIEPLARQADFQSADYACERLRVWAKYLKEIETNLAMEVFLFKSDLSFAKRATSFTNDTTGAATL